MNMLGPSGISAVFLLLSGFISILAVEEYSVSIEGWGGFGVIWVGYGECLLRLCRCGGWYVGCCGSGLAGGREVGA